MGKGSTFHFTIPVGVEKEKGEELVPVKFEDIENLPVLVVDDNSTNRRILQEMLYNWKMKPEVVDSGAKALIALNEAMDSDTPFQLVLLDANMPEMDGFSLAEHIQHDPSLSKTIIMMISSAGMRGDAARCRKLGTHTSIYPLPYGRRCRCAV